MRTRWAVALFVTILCAADARAQDARTLRWGGDAEGGAPFVEADPRDPDQLVGFDVEIAELIARSLGRTPQFLQVTFTSLDQSAKRGDFDIGLSGIEDTRPGARRWPPRIPYYEFREVLDGPRRRPRSLPTLARLEGVASPRSAARWPTRSCSRPNANIGLTAVSYDDDVHPYSGSGARPAWTPCCSTTSSPIARCGATAGPRHAAERVAVGHYIGVLAPANAPLRDRVDEDPARRDARRHARERSSANGRCGTTTSRGSIARRARERAVAATGGRGVQARRRRVADARTLPARLAGAAGMTLVLSCWRWRWPWRSAWLMRSGASTATGSSGRADVYVEVMRGTPVLLQLFVIYYGFAAVIRLPAFRRRAARARPELRGVRERDLSQRARGRAARTARCRAHPRASASGRRCG